ncbi:flagellar basal-body MS-ring/collar protein FliF [Pararhodobacter sp. CCB-MM2]|uniref:flagellar basal-body MS-ring/collar protein FliF n=1 Tax=Pararhodobacter sp. CCB-MM2 TaxID=1786003 RepID=UPI00082CBCFD|nr:flagellar basal-body MS-ring/collar protein FliF [Pararhodobacter sp. CCB-MM2]MCA2014428.1 flagellar M-ring protein FliF [Cereibacter sphaeroides]
MEQLLSTWNALEPRRRIIAVVAALGVFAAVLALTRLATAPGMSLLYAGLEGAQAGEVVQALDQRGIAYEVRGDAIYVDSTQRDETRMALAAQGLPANSSTGYELLDGLTGFGTTAQMFDAAYWRAKEGELARTIMASPHIRFARVHLAQSGSQPFRRDQQSSASVTVTPAGQALTAQQAQALRYLVSSAVPGMRAEDVAVIDSNGGMIVAEEDSPNSQSGDRAEQLRHNVERLLEARVGIGRAVVEVNVDTVTERELITERLVDPSSRAAVSQETEQRNNTSSDSGGAGVTVASNLPDGQASNTSGQSQSREQTSRERTAWEVSQTSREVERQPGAIRRLTVAVLVDGVRTLDANGDPQWTARPDDELTALRDLVASAVGFDEARGDVITLRSLQFEPLPTDLGTAGAASWVSALDMMGLIRLGALALVALILALFVLRPILKGSGGASNGGAAALEEDDPMAGFAPMIAMSPALTGEIDSDFGGGGDADESEDPVERMRQLIAERQDETMEILRSWMEEPEEQR